MHCCNGLSLFWIYHHPGQFLKRSVNIFSCQSWGFDKDSWSFQCFTELFGEFKAFFVRNYVFFWMVWPKIDFVSNNCQSWKLVHEPLCLDKPLRGVIERFPVHHWIRQNQTTTPFVIASAKALELGLSRYVPDDQTNWLIVVVHDRLLRKINTEWWDIIWPESLSKVFSAYAGFSNITVPD